MTELNHHNDGSGLIRSLDAAKADSTKVSLGNMHAIDDLVRKFVFDILDRFDKVSAGVMTPDAASAEDKARCVALGKIFAGQDPAYQPLPDWNDSRLASFVRSTMSGVIHPDEPDEGVLAQVFALLLHNVYREIRGMSDDSGVRLNKAIHSTVMLLVGIESNE
jgi:hypothetical protein